MLFDQARRGDEIAHHFARRPCDHALIGNAAHNHTGVVAFLNHVQRAIRVGINTDSVDLGIF
jgi:hypothetical protein